MRYLLYIVLLCQILTVRSCDSFPVKFSEPQPDGIPNEQAFNDKYKGVYHTPDTGITVIISDRMMVSEEVQLLGTSFSDIDTSLNWIKDGKLYGEEMPEEGAPVLIVNDSLYFNYSSIDTVFNFNEFENLKYYKKMYFLNYKIEDDEWGVIILRFNKKENLETCRIDNAGEIELLRTYTDVNEIINEEGDTASYIANPSKKELRRFIKAGGFGNTKEYFRR